MQAHSIMRTMDWPHLREEALSQHRQLLRQLPAGQMHDTSLETLVQGVHVVPGLLVNICFVTRIPLNLLPSPKGSVNTRLEVIYAFVLKQQIEALYPLLFARVLPLDLETFLWSTCTKCMVKKVECMKAVATLLAGRLRLCVEQVLAVKQVLTINLCCN